MRRVGLVFFAILLLPLLPAPVASTAPEAPWWEATLLDADRDGVDDALAPLIATGGRLTVLVAYERQPTPAHRAAVEARGFEVTFAPRHFPLLVAVGPAVAARDLLALPGVVFLEKNDELRPLLDESVPLIGAPQAWSRYGATGKGIVVAVLDDGAYEQHPDLEGKLAGSYNAAVPAGPLGGTGADVVVPAGEQGHGTHVAGTIVGDGGQSGGDFKGVAPDAKFVNVRVFEAPNRTSSDIVLRGLDWVLANKDALGIRVAQMSLGGRPSDGKDALSRSVDIAVDEGLVVVAAAGNAGPAAKTVSSPGAAEKAITVGAVDKRKAVAPFSSRGPTLDGRVKPDLAAPGRDIMSTVPPASTTTAGGLLAGKTTTYYGSLSGTSMAAPHVAGVVALMLEANPKLGPHDVKKILLATAQDLGAKGADADTGYGFVNGVAAVQVAKNPTLLQQAQYRSILATIPDPPEETFLERATYEMERMRRDGSLPLVALILLALFATIVVGAVGLVRHLRRARAP